MSTLSIYNGPNQAPKNQIPFLVTAGLGKFIRYTISNRLDLNTHFDIDAFFVVEEDIMMGPNVALARLTHPTPSY